MCFGVLLLCWCGLVFVPNWVFIKFPRPSQMDLSRFWISMASIRANLDARFQELSWSISQEASQCSLKYEVGDILDGFLMLSMWDIWNVFMPPKRWSYCSYYLCSYCRFGRKNKNYILVKLNGHSELSFSNLWQLSYLFMLFQRGRLCVDWR